MIIWLASYPRSGNTLLRSMLWRVYGKESYSKYNDITDIGGSAKTAEAIGHVNYDDEWPMAKQRMQNSEQVFFIKTHEPPEDDSDAIYIVREAAASIVSNYHYWKDIRDEHFKIDDLISGLSGPFLSWGSHLDEWRPTIRKQTLLIKYEDLIAEPSIQLKRISEFTQMRSKKRWKNEFETLRVINPKFFRRGKIEIDKKELSQTQLRLMKNLHSDWMVELGYLSESSDSTVLSECRYLRDLISNIREIRKQNRQLTIESRANLNALLVQRRTLKYISDTYLVRSNHWRIHPRGKHDIYLHSNESAIGMPQSSPAARPRLSVHSRTVSGTSTACCRSCDC